MPIRLTDAQSLAIANAAAALCPADRDQFLQAVARQLAGCEIGDGAVHRAVAVAFQAYWRAPDPVATRVPSRWNRVEPHFERASRR